MSVGRILVFIFAIALVCPHEVVRGKSIPFSSRFVSPDGSRSIDFVMIDKEWHFRITDLRNRQVDDSIVMPSLILYLGWASNSHAFVTVEHIAGGSYGRVVCLNENKWISSEVIPPGNSMMNFRVITLTMQQDRVHFRFAVDYEEGNGTPVYYTFCEIDVELGTARILNTTSSSISRAEWLASLKRQPSYSPAMTKGQKAN
jgi:hypothetical protein